MPLVLSSAGVARAPKSKQAGVTHHSPGSEELSYQVTLFPQKMKSGNAWCSLPCASFHCSLICSIHIDPALSICYAALNPPGGAPVLKNATPRRSAGCHDGWAWGWGSGGDAAGYQDSRSSGGWLIPQHRLCVAAAGCSVSTWLQVHFSEIFNLFYLWNVN